MKFLTEEHSVHDAHSLDDFDVVSRFGEPMLDEQNELDSSWTADDVLAEVPHAFAVYRDHQRSQWG